MQTVFDAPALSVIETMHGYVHETLTGLELPTDELVVVGEAALQVAEGELMPSEITVVVPDSTLGKLIDTAEFTDHRGIGRTASIQYTVVDVGVGWPQRDQAEPVRTNVRWLPVPSSQIGTEDRSFDLLARDALTIEGVHIQHPATALQWMLDTAFRENEPPAEGTCNAVGEAIGLYNGTDRDALTNGIELVVSSQRKMLHS